MHCCRLITWMSLQDGGFWANLALYFSWASSAGWLNALAGLWLVVVSAVMLIIGKYASVSLRKMESALADEEAVRAAFARAHDRLCQAAIESERLTHRALTAQRWT